MRIISLRQRRKHIIALKFDLPPDEIDVGEALKREKRFDEYGYLLLDMDTCLDAGLCDGQVLDSDELLELITRSDYNRAKSYGIWRLGYKPYSANEMAKLLTPEYGRLAAEQAVCRMCELGLLNDEQYAADLANKYINIKKCAPRDAVYKIMQKGIDRAVAQAAVDETEPDIDAQLTALIQQKYIHQLEDEKGLRRTIAALARKGYGYGDIRSAIAKFADGEYFEE